MEAYLGRFLKRKDLVSEAIKILDKNGFNGKSVIRMLRAKRTLFRNKLIKAIGCYFTRIKDGILTEDIFFYTIKNPKNPIF